MSLKTIETEEVLSEIKDSNWDEEVLDSLIFYLAKNDFVQIIKVLKKAVGDDFDKVVSSIIKCLSSQKLSEQQFLFILKESGYDEDLCCQSLDYLYNLEVIEDIKNNLSKEPSKYYTFFEYQERFDRLTGRAC